MPRFHEWTRLALLTALTVCACRAIWWAGSAAYQVNQVIAENRAPIAKVIATGPNLAQWGEVIAGNVAGITTDVHTLTTKAATPETTKQKIVSGLKIGALILSKFIP